MAGLIIGIDHRHQFVRRYCRGWIVKNRAEDFHISVSRSDIARESEKHGCQRGIAENICIHRELGHRLMDWDAFVMHAAVVSIDDEAYAFAGPSGIGKTTHIRLWRDCFGERVRAINGDKPVLRFFGDTLYACGTPWRGKERIGNNIRYPLKAVCFLEQADENRIRRLDDGEVLDRIFKQLLMPNTKAQMQRLMDLIERMIAQTDFYLLSCKPEKEAAILAYREMSGKNVEN